MQLKFNSILTKALNIANIWFRFCSEKHNYETSHSCEGNLFKSSLKTNIHGKYSATSIVVKSWKKIPKQLKNTLPKNLSSKKIKTVASNFYLKSQL